MEALSFKERGTFNRPHSRTPSSRSIVPLSSISDADITIDFHLEQKDNQVINCVCVCVGVCARERERACVGVGAGACVCVEGVMFICMCIKFKHIHNC